MLLDLYEKPLKKLCDNIKMLWWRRKAIQDYHLRLIKLKNVGRSLGLTDKEIEVAYQQSIDYLKEVNHLQPASSSHEKRRRNHSIWKKILAIATFLIGFYSCYMFYKPAHNFVERNIQDVIYPFMTAYRRITLPIIKLLPFLTELYDESCLLDNPYFQVSDMECWPCENARFVLNLTESMDNAHVGLPFVAKTSHPPLSLNDLCDAYLDHKFLIDNNAGRVKTNVGWWKINNILGNCIDIMSNYPGLHASWRINRMETGRVLRPLLKPPQGNYVPHYASSLGIERFILIDGPAAGHYPLPSPEGANVFLKQLSGQRLIVLEPAPECRISCRRLSFLLEEQHILWYNWWYWRPRSLPVQNSSTFSISFLGSTT